MTKILLVEDDKSLREIYGVRLLAEGYDIVSAGDGEEALAMAIKEKPLLIISDVMMPKISGFDMLDILRSTTETKNIKVIMMTALSSDDQRARGEQLGADRYLVKSQVGIEDVVRTVHEVLGDSPNGQNQQTQEEVTNAAPVPTDVPVAQSPDTETSTTDNSAPEIVSEPLASPPSVHQSSSSDSDVLPSSPADVEPLPTPPVESVGAEPASTASSDPGPLPPQPTETPVLDAQPTENSSNVSQAPVTDSTLETTVVGVDDYTAGEPDQSETSSQPQSDPVTPNPPADPVEGMDLGGLPAPDVSPEAQAETFPKNEGLNFDMPQTNDSVASSVAANSNPVTLQLDTPQTLSSEATLPSDLVDPVNPVSNAGSSENTTTTDQQVPTQ